MISRFAPSTTGEAHPGTLLAALLVWLDARRAGRRVILRLENLDVTRARPGWAAHMALALAWLGLDWDQVVTQSDRYIEHEQALDALAAAGRLYPCACSRSDRAGLRRAPDGGWAYDNRCRARALPVTGWRTSTESLRVRLDDDRIELVDQLGVDLSQTPAVEMGDPIVRRRDGVIAYQLAVVVDDAASGITDIVRGRDIAPSTATQIALQRILGVPTPGYRHHCLLLEPHGEKLAKLHGSIPFDALRAHYTGEALCGLLAHAANLTATADPVVAASLVDSFDWARVPRDDRVARWDGQTLVLQAPAPVPFG